MEWDVFISHSSRDKSFVRRLALALQQGGLKIWYDEFTLQIGDSLRRSIDQGLASSRFGIVVLSNNFFAGEWPRKELDGLVSREDGRQKVILPVWLEITQEEVRRFSPILADKFAVSGDGALEAVVAAILAVVNADTSQNRTARRVQRLIAELHETDSAEERGAVIDALGRIGPPAFAAALILAERLQDSETHGVPWRAARALGTIGPAAREAVPALANAVLTGHREVAEAAAQALGKMGEAAEMAIPSLISALDRSDAGHSGVMAARALATAGPRALSALISILESGRIPYFTFLALQEMGPRAAAAVPSLRKLLARPHSYSWKYECEQIVQVLGAIGSEAFEALPDLLEILEQEPMNFISKAIVAIGADPDVAGPALVRALLRHEKVDPGISEALARLGRKGVPHLVTALRSGDKKACFYVVRALHSLGHEAEDAVDALTESLARSNADLGIISALGAIGPAAQIAVPQLVELARARNETAVEALGLIEPAETGVPILLGLLETEPHWYVLLKILKALSRYGPAASAAGTYVKKLLDHEKEEIRLEASNTLQALRD